MHLPRSVLQNNCFAIIMIILKNTCKEVHDLIKLHPRSLIFTSIGLFTRILKVYHWRCKTTIYQNTNSRWLLLRNLNLYKIYMAKKLDEKWWFKFIELSSSKALLQRCNWGIFFKIAVLQLWLKSLKNTCEEVHFLVKF